MTTPESTSAGHPALTQREGDRLPLIPYPRLLEQQPGVLSTRVLRFPAADAPHAHRARGLLEQHGYTLDAAGEAALTLVVDPSLAVEAYHLTIGVQGIHISGGADAGVFYGLQTLRQLLRRDAPLPFLHIEDAPQFPWRGLMLDVGRHFMPLEFVKKLIDLLAQHKLNTFHFHLSDDQGWRLEIRRYPRLTEVGAWRSETQTGHGDELPHAFDGTPHGGFYTQDEIRELVAYAGERHVTVLPEIDMPGHMLAAIAAYPELGNHPDRQHQVGNFWGIVDHVLNIEESSFEFFQNVLLEIFELFPSAYVHLGGDECPPDEWGSTERTGERMRELGLRTPEDVQPYFMQRMATFLKRHGKHFVGWDEVIDNTNLERDSVIMAWRPSDYSLEALQQGFPVVMCPNLFTYLDHYQKPAEELEQPLAIGGHLPWEKVYRWTVYPEGASEAQRQRVLGAQVQVWTEYIKTPEHAEFMTFPRLSAFSEVVWSYPAQRDTKEMTSRLSSHLPHLGIRHGPL